ncbi:MAG: glycine cleavage system aminomethyltransferase GcvT [Chloroflexi bacterium]|nr:glycine cleavage system aminomethyltransferase GcvT [Chloroflexota bacterium]
MTDSNELRRTSLYDTHVSLGARIVPFGGWAMPIQYDSILREARAVRSNVGLFDVSHMGRLKIQGSGAARLLSRVLSVGAISMRPTRARYCLICNEEGGIIDDCIVYRNGEEDFLLVPNAANTATVIDWLNRWNTQPDAVSITNITTETAMIAVQGPQAIPMLNGITADDISNVLPFRTATTQIDGVETMLAHTGYTGEDGFELIVPAQDAPRIWLRLVESGAASCGLGARDVLRLEAGLLLHGNDMSVDVNPYEAGLARFVNPDRRGYVAREALLRARDEGVDKSLVGFFMTGRGIARHGHAIYHAGACIGEVTSGSPSPLLDRNIGLGYVAADFSEVGTRLQIDIRGRLVDAEVTSLPFYIRSI